MADEIKNQTSTINHDDAVREAYAAFVALGAKAQLIVQDLEDTFAAALFDENALKMARNAGRIEVLQYIVRRMAESQQEPTERQEQAQ